MPTTITISTFQPGPGECNFLGTTVKLRRYYDQDWTDVDGVFHAEGVVGSSTGFFDEVSCTLSSNTITVPAFSATPTDNPQTGSNIRETWQLWDQAGSARTIIFEGFIPSANPTITFGALLLLNHGQTLFESDRQTRLDQWIQQYIDTVIGTLNDAGVYPGGPKGRVYLSTAAAVPSEPRAISETDPRVPSTQIVYYADRYATLAAAVTAIGATNATLVVGGLLPSAGATVPSNITLSRVGSGMLTGTGTVNIKGPIVSDLQQFFASTLTVNLAGNSKVAKLCPQWWGTKADGRIVTRCVTTAASTTINCTDGDFTSADIGKDFTAYLTTNWGRGLTTNFQTGGNAGAAGIPLQGTIQSVSGATQFVSSVAATSNLSSTNASAGAGSVSSTSHNVFLGTDDTAAIQACLTASDTCGAEVYFAPGMYYVKGSGAELFRFYKAKRISGAGSYSRIMFAASVPTTTDIFHVTPSGYYQPNGLGNEVYPLVPSQRMLKFEDFTIEAVAGRPGQYGIHIDFTSPGPPYGSNLTMMFTDNILVWGTSSFSLYINNAAGQTVGGLSQSMFAKSHFHEGVGGALIGDTIQFGDNCTFSGAGFALDLSWITGASTLRVENCNITSARGIKLRGGHKHVIENNIIEIAWTDGAGVTGSNGAIIDLDAGAESIDNVTISNNQFGNFAAPALNGVRVAGTTVAWIDQNSFDLTGGYGVEVDDTSAMEQSSNRLVNGLGIVLNSGSSPTIISAVRSFDTIQATNDSEHVGARSIRASSFLEGVQPPVTTSKTLVATGDPTAELHVSNWGVIPVDATAGAVVITVPQVNNSYMYGRKLTIIKIDASVNTVTFTPTVNTVNGAGTLVISSQWGTAKVISGTVSSPNWLVI